MCIWSSRDGNLRSTILLQHNLEAARKGFPIKALKTVRQVSKLNKARSQSQLTASWKSEYKERVHAWAARVGGWKQILSVKKAAPAWVVFIDIGGTRPGFEDKFCLQNLLGLGLEVKEEIKSK